MLTATDACIALLKTSHQRTARLLRLNEDLDPEQSIEGSTSSLLDATVSAVRGRRNRYTVTGSLANSEGTWTPDVPTDPFWPRTIWALDVGILVSGENEWLRQATFLIRDPLATGTGGSATLRFSGMDRLSLGDKSAFTRPELFPRGTAVSRAIFLLLRDAGLGDDPSLYILDDGGRLLQANVVGETGLYRTEVAEDIALAHSLQLHTDRYGRVVLEPEPSVLPGPVWEFRYGETALYTGMSRSIDDLPLFNHTVVIGEGQGTAVIGEWRDLDPTSPVYNPPPGHPDYPGPVGDLVYPVVHDALIRDVPTATERARVLGTQVALVDDSLDVTAYPNPLLDPGDVIHCVDPIMRVDRDEWVDEITTPLDGAQSIVTKRLRSLVLE